MVHPVSMIPIVSKPPTRLVVVISCHIINDILAMKHPHVCRLIKSPCFMDKKHSFHGLNQIQIRRFLRHSCGVVREAKKLGVMASEWLPSGN